MMRLILIIGVASRLFGISNKETDAITDQLRELHIEFINVSRDFLHVARTISKFIISEVYLPEQKKTIKPVTGLGGVIGGQKFIVQNVLFKFAVGRPEMNVSNEVAAKIAGHELKSLSHLWEFDEPPVALKDAKSFEDITAAVAYNTRKLFCLTTSSKISE